MARKMSAPTTKPGRAAIAGGLGISPEERQAMIREAAYERYVQRGYVVGHDLDDWLAAEVELDLGMPEGQPEETLEFEVQQSSVHGAAEDDELKRIIRQHPQKGIPQVEGVEPENAPLKE